ncbi:hypothetical protein EXN66_Car010189 [Channa argus]|uniref:Uncharacterized protein n=1 Tax=Channa argus TaxID=215402 RepID=A0A6G1PWF6_CHAAH|nr:hypothetical protein EXN66_Car010189 [Channa argus]
MEKTVQKLMFKKVTSGMTCPVDILLNGSVRKKCNTGGCSSSLSLSHPGLMLWMDAQLPALAAD